MSAELIREAADWLETDMVEKKRAIAKELRALAASMEAAEPKLWAEFADNGNIRLWTADQHLAKRMPAHGKNMVPLYLHPADDAKDAERYRFQRDNDFRYFTHTGEWVNRTNKTTGKASSYEKAIDAAISAERKE